MVCVNCADKAPSCICLPGSVPAAANSVSFDNQPRKGNKNSSYKAVLVVFLFCTFKPGYGKTDYVQTFDVFQTNKK